MSSRTRSKADLLGPSSSFAAAQTPIHMERGRLTEEIGLDAQESAAPPRVARLEDLALNPFNPRVTLTAIADMAESLLQDGQLQGAAVVTREAFLGAFPGCEAELGEARYVVIDGNRRLAGARQAGLEELRIDVNDDLARSDSEALTKALVANIHNETLSPMEEARALEKLLPVYGGQRPLARRLSKSHPWVGQRLALLQLTSGLQAAVESGDLPVEDARRIGRLPQDEQATAAQQAAAARQEQKSRRTAGRRAAGEAPADLGSDSAGTRDDATPPPGSAPPPTDEAGGAGPSGATDGPSGASGPVVRPADGKVVTAPPPASDAAGGTDDGTDARSARTPSAPLSAGAGPGPGPGNPAGSPAAGNGAATPPARTRTVRSPGTGDIDWADLHSLATLIRARLAPDQLRDLLGLLAGD